MKNPWEEIPLADYENHMKLDSVMQLQAMNEMMKGQFDAYSISSVMILGIAGGNGLEHIQKSKFEKGYGIDSFQNVINHVSPKYVSCIIQLNLEGNWVSDSPYLHTFDGVEQVHHQIEEHALEQAMLEIEYRSIKTLERILPNGKKLVQIDFER